MKVFYLYRVTTILKCFYFCGANLNVINEYGVEIVTRELAYAIQLYEKTLSWLFFPLFP